jgi:hypothetical protein
VLLGFVVAILPWTIRNYNTFGAWFYLRGNLPLELWSGNGPWADGYGDIASEDKPHPVFDRREAQRMVELGEWGYFQACRREVARWWGRDKRRFIELTVDRVRWFWLGRHDFAAPAAARAIKLVSVAGTGILALLGSVLVLWRRAREGWVLVATAAVFPLPYYATQIMVRYRLPLEPILLILAAGGIVIAWRRLRGRPGGGGRQGRDRDRHDAPAAGDSPPGRLRQTGSAGGD